MAVDRGEGGRQFKRPVFGLLLLVAAGVAGTPLLAASDKAPGVQGDIAGQVPSQARQAREAPVPAPGVAAPHDAVLTAFKGWWEAGQGGIFPAEMRLANPSGELGIINADGAFDTKGHPFFEPLGPNGRACVTCHQPANAMSVSTDALQARWAMVGHKDPVFAPVDGANCPGLPQAERASHSLLLDHGLFRIFLPWPPKAADRTAITPEFTIEVVRDPTGCNLDPVYGLNSANPMVSVFRRPRPVVNQSFVTATRNVFNTKTGMPVPFNPETGLPVSMNLTWDARHPTLKSQAVDAALNHQQMAAPPTADQLNTLVAFEMQLYAAQASDRVGGQLEEPGGPDALGPGPLSRRKTGGLGDNLENPAFGRFEMWKPRPGAPSDARSAFRASVARGHDVFFLKPFWIRNSTHINSIGLGNPVKRTCSTCHNEQLMGIDVAPSWIDIGTTSAPWSDPQPYLPLFKLTCDKDRPPHPYLGRVIYTHDPGRALITGKCVDVGAINMSQFRGLAARAPYFSNGSAKDLRAVADFYDRRYGIGYTEQEKQDLINFLSVL